MNVTDEMVERAFRVMQGRRGIVGHIGMREVLDAALNPPQEPEIVVSAAMECAGYMAMEDWRLGPSDPVKVFRAMRKLEPEPFKIEWRAHKRASDRAHNMPTMHRRSSDPKISEQT